MPTMPLPCGVGMNGTNQKRAYPTTPTRRARAYERTDRQGYFPNHREYRRPGGLYQKGAPSLYYFFSSYGIISVNWKDGEAIRQLS